MHVASKTHWCEITVIAILFSSKIGEMIFKHNEHH